MQINNINSVKFGQLHLDDEATTCYSEDSVANLNNVNSMMDFYKKIQFAENAPIDFFVNGNGDHEFRAVAINQKTGEYYGRIEDYSVHHAINNIIDTVKKRLS